MRIDVLTIFPDLVEHFAAASLRAVEHRGGLDAYLLKANDTELSQNARNIKKEILKKQAAA